MTMTKKKEEINLSSLSRKKHQKLQVDEAHSFSSHVEEGTERRDLYHHKEDEERRKKRKIENEEGRKKEYEFISSGKIDMTEKCVRQREEEERDEEKDEEESSGSRTFSGQVIIQCQGRNYFLVTLNVLQCLLDGNCNKLINGSVGHRKGQSDTCTKEARKTERKTLRWKNKGRDERKSYHKKERRGRKKDEGQKLRNVRTSLVFQELDKKNSTRVVARSKPVIDLRPSCILILLLMLLTLTSSASISSSFSFSSPSFSSSSFFPSSSYTNDQVESPAIPNERSHVDEIESMVTQGSISDDRIIAFTKREGKSTKWSSKNENENEEGKWIVDHRKNENEIKEEIERRKRKNEKVINEEGNNFISQSSYSHKSRNDGKRRKEEKYEKERCEKEKECDTITELELDSEILSSAKKDDRKKEDEMVNEINIDFNWIKKRDEEEILQGRNLKKQEELLEESSRTKKEEEQNRNSISKSNSLDSADEKVKEEEKKVKEKEKKDGKSSLVEKEDEEDAFLMMATSKLATEFGDPLLEGDIVIPKELFQVEGRTAVAEPVLYWPGAVIPYQFHSSVSQADQSVIEAAMKHWESETCVTFRAREGLDYMWIRFRGDSQGCWSLVGRQFLRFGVGQDVSIGPGCAQHHVVTHEIGHVVGFFHEQSRSDRDEAIKINWDNVEDGYELQFKKEDDVNFGYGYDYSSVMQYPAWAFSKKVLEKNTIVTIDPRHQRFLGANKAGLSFRDKAIANKLYNCDRGCPNTNQCQNQGYLKPYRSNGENCECECPPNTSGRYCETITNEDYYESLSPFVCGGNVTSPGIIMTPDYPARNSPKQSCVWIIEAPSGKNVEIEILGFNFQPRVVKPGHKTDGKCYHEAVEIRLADDHNGDHYCGSDLSPGTKLTSSGSRAIIIVLADEKMIGQGLQANISYVDGTSSGNSGNSWQQQTTSTTIDPFGGIWDRIWVRWRSSTTTSTTTELPIPIWG